VAVALVHHPVRNRQGEVVTTSVTNLDVHDFARICRTYGAAPFYLATPIEAQRDMVRSIVSRWEAGPDHPRREALAGIAVVASLPDAVADLAARVGARPDVIVTGANLRDGVSTFAAVRASLADGSRHAALVVFGTGWGLAREVTDAADARLEAIDAGTGFNHLPVRAALAIVLDRLLGPGLY
jgi:hypothetical protein